jgi:tRNA (guanine37-N1)-methyltransferase
VLLCGRYEGVDQRVVDHYGFEEISLGDFVLMGGELPAMVVIEGCVRLLEGVLGNQESTRVESFAHGLLEYPQYTRPRIWQDREVPPVLLSGNHSAIEKWRQEASEKITQLRRPDLWTLKQSRSIQKK